MAYSKDNRDRETYRYKLERVSRGYVRVSVNADDINQLFEDWNKIHSRLEEIGEKVETVDTAN